MIAQRKPVKELRLPVTVILTEAQAAKVLQAARGRERMAARSNHIDKYNRDPRVASLPVRINAIGAEFAVADALGCRWHDTDKPDWGGDGGMLGVQVRQTPYPFGRLLLHPEDKDDHWFFLVCGVMPEFCIVGAILGGDGKRVGAWTELAPNRPAICVEQSALKKCLVRWR